MPKHNLMIGGSTKMAISTLISALKKKSKLSAKEFADLFEISEKTLADWESGNSTPEVAQVARLAKHFNIYSFHF